MASTDFGAREVAPVERLVLRIVFAKRQRRDGLREFITEIEGM